ncbi:hypothetical protein BGZ61DRAFT_352599, partial [Ilyonectria robusta]|uniref:uncharacterized protein n=1 Tax=Ilyonectria robusta TaxID=1079257 RepID=UPI001E8CBEA8
MQRTQEHQAILDWLTPIDYALQQSHHFNRRQNGTGQWLLHSPELKAWTETDRETLFCPGIPGAGKTILTSIVINDLMDRFQNDSSTGLVYIYCDLQRQEEQRADGLLANVLKQLAQCHVSLPESLKSLHDHHQGRRTRPSFDDIWSTLQSVSALFAKVFIVVDALDEFQSADCRTRILSAIFDLQAKYNVKLFATSRWVAEIVEKFEGSLTLPIRATDGDLKIYLDDRMKRLQSFIVYDPALQMKIEARISDRADGMFLFAARLMDSLAEEPTEGHLNRALDSLPEKLNDTYEQSMGRIETLGRNRARLAKKILSWVIHAKRLLSTREIRIAAAVEPGQQGLEVGFVPSPETVGSLCAGLITIDTQRDVVRLAHQTTKEYFDQAKEKWFPSAESEIAVICVTYLSFNIFADGFCKTDNKFEERLQSHQLYDYAAQNWGYHTRKSSQLSQPLKDFLACDAKSEASSQALLAVKYSSSHSNYSQQVPRAMAGLHLAAYFGLREAVEYLLADGSFPNSRDSYYRTPLWWAAYEGQRDVVELLLTDDRMDPDSKDNYQRTPLSWAAEKGHHEVVKLFLARKGVDPNSRDNINKKTPL